MELSKLNEALFVGYADKTYKKENSAKSDYEYLVSKYAGQLKPIFDKLLKDLGVMALGKKGGYKEDLNLAAIHDAESGKDLVRSAIGNAVAYRTSGFYDLGTGKKNPI